MKLAGRVDYVTVAIAGLNVVVSALELYFRPTFNDLQDEQRRHGTIRSQED
jgi:hypothetical protein